MGQAGTDVVNFALIVYKMILTDAQAALFGVIKEEIGVVFAVVTLAQNFDLRAVQQGLEDGLLVADGHLGLHLETLFLGGAADGDELGQNRLLAGGEEGVNLAGVFHAAGQDLCFVEGEQFAAAHDPLAVNHHVGYVGGFGGVNDLRIGSVGVAAEEGGVVDLAVVHQNQVGAFARL